jgi:hypothetical protein
MSIFKKLAGEKVFTSSKFFQPGTYVVDINAVKFIEKGTNGDSMVVETTVRGVRSDEDAAPQPGEVAAHVWNMGKTMALSTWKGFLIGAYELSATDQEGMSDQDWEELSEATYGDGNALEGVRMFLYVWEKTTKAGNPFTMHNWERRATPADLEEFGLE